MARLLRELPLQTRIPFEPPERTARRRDAAVRAAVAHAARSVPFWRETFRRLTVDPDEIRTFADLSRLPIVTRDDVQPDPERFRTEKIAVGDCLEMQSSGTSGTPITVWHSPEAAMAAAAHGERQRRIVTRRIGRLTGYVQANLVASESGSFQRGTAFFRHAIVAPDRLRVRHVPIPFMAPLEEQLALIEALAPPVLAGFGSALERILLAGGAPGLQVVRFGGDAMGASAREAAERRGVLVLGTYGSIETMRMGFECGHGPRLHLNEDISPIRLIDGEGRDAALGEPGDVIVSNLVNRGSVLLNYRLGDVGLREPGSCPCGRTLPLMTLLEGRSDEVLVLGGKEIHPHSLGGFPHAGVRRVRLVQEVPNRLRIDVELVPGAAGLDVSESVERWCSERFEPGAVEVRLVDELRPGPSGKHRVVVGLSGAGGGS